MTRVWPFVHTLRFSFGLFWPAGQCSPSFVLIGPRSSTFERFEMTLPPERAQRLGNPHHQPRAELATTSGELAPLPARPPRGLAREGRALWRAVVASGAGAWLKASDAAMLRLICQQADTRAELALDVKTRGAMVEEPILVPGQRADVTRPNPAIAAMIQLDKEISRGLRALGLTPTDRARLGLLTAAAENEFDRWLKANGGAPERGSR